MTIIFYSSVLVSTNYILSIQSGYGISTILGLKLRKETYSMGLCDNILKRNFNEQKWQTTFSFIINVVYIFEVAFNFGVIFILGVVIIFWIVFIVRVVFLFWSILIFEVVL